MTSLGFAEAARLIGGAARAAGFEAPSFRSPPRAAGCSRSIRHRRNGSATVAVSIRGRPAAGIAADMIDGVVVANRLDGAKAAALRDHLWAAFSAQLAAPAPLAEVRPIRAA